MFDRLTVQLQRYFVEHAYEILGALAFLLAAVLVAYWLGRIIRFVMSDSFEIEESITNLAVRLFRFTLITLSLVVVLDEFGINVTSVIAAFSVLGLAMAFGLRTTMTNFFTGAMISALKPYEVGDEIDAERVKGIVESTNLFSTVVVTDDGTYVAVPNGPMWAKSIRNKSRIRPIRLVLEIRAGHGVSFGELRKVTEQVLRTTPSRHTAFDPIIKIEDVTERSILVRASSWFDPDAYWAARDALPGAMTEKLRADGIPDVDVLVRPLTPAKKATKEPSSEPPADDLF